MSWDRRKAVDYFMEQYSRFNPDQYRYRPNAQQLKGVYDTELALQKLYTECAAAAEDRRSLLCKLDQLIKNAAEDNRAFNPAEYKSIIKLEASLIKRKIETGILCFEE
jgi:hypothetical protein